MSTECELLSDFIASIVSGRHPQKNLQRQFASIGILKASDLPGKERALRGLYNFGRIKYETLRYEAERHGILLERIPNWQPAKRVQPRDREFVIRRLKAALSTAEHWRSVAAAKGWIIE